MNKTYLSSDKEVSEICNEVEAFLNENGYICVDDFISSKPIEVKRKIKEELIRNYRDSDDYNIKRLIELRDNYKRLKSKFKQSKSGQNEEKLHSIKTILAKIDTECQTITGKIESIHKELNEKNFRRFFLQDVYQEIEKRRDRLFRNNEDERLEARYKEIESLNSESNDILSQIDDLQMKIDICHSQIKDLTTKLNYLRNNRERYIEEEKKLGVILDQEREQTYINKKLLSDSKKAILNYVIYRITLHSEKLYIHNVFKFKLLFIEETKNIHEIIENVNKVNDSSNSRTNEQMFEELLSDSSFFEDYIKNPFIFKDNNQLITKILEKFLEYYRVAINRSLNNKKQKESMLFFRGHTDSNYLSIPSVFRNQGFIENEHIMFHEIQVRCSTEMVNSKSYLEKLTSMQHYSLPTRLLDVTSSVMVALFFAVEQNYEIDGELIIYNLYKNELKYFDSDTVEMLSALSTLSFSDKRNLLEDTINASVKLIVNSFPKSIKNNEKAFLKNLLEEMNLIKIQFNEKVIVKKLSHEIQKQTQITLKDINPLDLLDVCFVKPVLNNNRIIRQQGAFIVNGLLNNGNGTDRYRVSVGSFQSPIDNIIETLDEEMRESLEKHTSFNKVITRYIVPSGKKKMLKKWLRDLSMDESVIYPDFENIASYLKDAYGTSNQT